MTGTFLDTIVICSLTGLCLVVTGAWCAPGLAGFRITEQAWRTALPWPAGLSSFLLLACLVFFAFSTIIGWNFYGEQCLRYLTGGSQRAQRLYRWCYLAALCARAAFVREGGVGTGRYPQCVHGPRISRPCCCSGDRSSKGAGVLREKRNYVN